MKILYSQDKICIFKLQKGEELLSALSTFVLSKNIPSAYFTMIGAVSLVTLSFYNLKTKQYQDTVFDEDLEITSVMGNIAYVDGEPKIHAHGTFSRDDYSVLGGHIQKLIVSATGEIHLTKIDKKLIRKFDEETGLYLLSKD